MADATVLKTVGGDPVRVRVPSPALDYKALKRLWVCLIDSPEAFCVANHVAKVPDPWLSRAVGSRLYCLWARKAALKLPPMLPRLPQRAGIWLTV